jgi:predicted nucleic acid-binding protein
LILSSDLEARLRRIKPEKHRRRLAPRSATELSFLDRISRLPTKFLYDTTVYIDVLQGRFPNAAHAVLRAVEAWHSPVTESELLVSVGLLNPDHPDTRTVAKQIVDSIEERSPYRVAVPDREVWQMAGVLSGTLARLQGYGREERRRLLNDALLFASARKYGMAVLTRNVRDFDFLHQLDTGGSVVFYARS